MLERILRFSVVFLVGCFLLPGCSHFTENGRAQLRCQKYAKKCRRDRERLETKVVRKQKRIPAHPVSDYQVSSGVVDGPQSVSSGESQAQ